MLSIRLLCSLPTTVYVATDSIVNQVALLSSNNGLWHSKQYCVSGSFASFQQWSVQLQIALLIRSLCSLLTTVYNTVSNIIYQVALLPSYTDSLHCCKSARFAHCLFQFIPIYPNLFEFILNFIEFYRVFEWKEKTCEKLNYVSAPSLPCSFSHTY